MIGAFIAENRAQATGAHGDGKPPKEVPCRRIFSSEASDYDSASVGGVA